MTGVRKTLAVLLTNSGLLFGAYLGTAFHYEINKMWLNSFEKRTPVKEGHYQNIGEIKLFYEKIDGELIPCYGLNDKKITIGNDLMPNGFLTDNNLNYNNLNNLIDLIEENINIDNFTNKEKKELGYRIEKLRNEIKPLNQNQKTYLEILSHERIISDSLDYLIKAFDIYNKSKGIEKDAMTFYVKELIR